MKNFLSSHSAKKICRETRLCFRKFRVSKNFMPKREISRFSIEILLCHCTEKLRRGTLFCFTKFLVSKKFMYKRGGRGRITIFCRKISVSQCRKISQRNPSDLCFRKRPVARKCLWIRGGGECQAFPSKILLSHRAEKFRTGIL